MLVKWASTSGQFQCPFGHSGILTCSICVGSPSRRKVSMPFRAFGDSDRSRKWKCWIGISWFQCPFGHSGILTDVPWAGVRALRPRFQCPFGHSGILTPGGRGFRPQGVLGVSMPFRAFGDSDVVKASMRKGEMLAFQCPFGHSGILTHFPGDVAIPGHKKFQCPFGHSGILTGERRTSAPAKPSGFQCPFGHSGILTHLLQLRPPRVLQVSMPFRAFGDSDG